MTATTTRRLFAPRFSLVVALGAILSLVLLGSPAHADASTDGTADVVTFDEYRALIDDLTASDVPRTTATVDGRTVHTFTIESPATGTFELSMVDVKSEEEFVGDEGTMHPNLGGGWDSSGPYVSFNQVDQDALIAGTAGALVLAICLICRRNAGVRGGGDPSHSGRYLPSRLRQVPRRPQASPRNPTAVLRLAGRSPNERATGASDRADGSPADPELAHAVEASPAHAVTRPPARIGRRSPRGSDLDDRGHGLQPEP